MTYQSSSKVRRVNGREVTIELEYDGVQRSEVILDSRGSVIGSIWTGRHTDWVFAKCGDEANDCRAQRYGKTKPECFTLLRNWIVEKAA